MTSFICNPLLVPELFRCILDCFLLENYSLEIQAERRALAALAQTCRALSEPSLDRLWRELDAFYPLIRCFTPSLQAVDRDKRDDYRLDELEAMIPPTPAEWVIIKRYSHRVREISILSESLSLRFLKSIGSQASPLFPNLMILDWCPRGSHLRWPIALINLLLSPTLLKLRALLTEEDGVDLHLFLRNYHLQCPNLESVEFNFKEGETVSGTTTHELSRAVCSHKRLEHLEVHEAPINATALRWLSMSQTIKFLSIHHHPQEPTPQHYFRPEYTPFRHVKELELTTLDFDFVISILRPREQKFCNFRLHLHDRPTAKATSTFFSLLASRPDVASLGYLSLSFTMPSPMDATPGELKLRCLSYHSLRPLMSFRCLQELVIDWSHEISIDDEELADLACCWPSLEVFVLNCRCRRGVPPLARKYLTLNGLLKLVASCPNLRDVCLPLNARDIPTGPDPDVRNATLENLDFPESPICDAHSVAEFLLKHFSCLFSVFGEFRRRPYPSRVPMWRHQWARVDSYLSRFPEDSDGSEIYSDVDD